MEFTGRGSAGQSSDVLLSADCVRFTIATRAMLKTILWAKAQKNMPNIMAASM